MCHEMPIPNEMTLAAVKKFKRKAKARDELACYGKMTGINYLSMAEGISAFVLLVDVSFS
jgi:UDP-galactopyranose mutase